jgi:ribosomal protein S1
MAERIHVTIRATNGTPWETEFNTHQNVGHVRDAAVKHFVKEGVMQDGDYLLALVDEGEARELPDSQTLAEAEVTDAAVLVLMVRGPQVDG